MIYLDYNATTPVDPAVAEAMIPWITRHHGNPSGVWSYGESSSSNGAFIPWNHTEADGSPAVDYWVNLPFSSGFPITTRSCASTHQGLTPLR